LTLEPDPYESGRLFHGPAFQLLRELRIGATGATAILDAGVADVPKGLLHPALLDAATHAIPHDNLARWAPELGPDQVAYPHRIPSIRFYGPTPTSGVVRVEARLGGFDGSDPRFPCIDLQLIAEGRIWAELRLVEVLLPKGSIGQAAPESRMAFLRDQRYVPGVGLSRVVDGVTRLRASEVAAVDWLPGNVARIYALSGGIAPAIEIAIKEHVAPVAEIHPSRIIVSEESAVAANRPLRRHEVTVTVDEEIAVCDREPPRLDIKPIRDYWRRWFGLGPWPVEDIYYGLIEKIVGDVVLADPDAFAAVHGRSCLYLANHQVAVESLLFSVLTSALSGVSTLTLAKAEHRASWIGQLIAHSFAYPGARDPGVIAFFEREDRAALLGIIAELGAAIARGEKSVMVHVEGTRALQARQPVVKMSSAFIDMALQVGAPIVPVRFVGALPIDPLEERLEYPVGYGRQDTWIGRPILPEEIRSIPLKERKQVVIDALNALGPPLAAEQPLAPDPAFEADVRAWEARTGVQPEHAALRTAITRLPTIESEGMRRILAATTADSLNDGTAEGAWLAGLGRWFLGR
jgi:1-acyl-sn-glycerol-3-phosphate acyltransferase